MAKTATTFESLPAEIRQEILLEATALEEFNDEVTDHQLFYHVPTTINDKQLRPFAILLRISKSVRKDLLFVAKKHHEKMSSHRKELIEQQHKLLSVAWSGHPDPFHDYDVVREMIWVTQNAIIWCWNMNAGMEKVVEQLQNEAED